MRTVYHNSRLPRGLLLWLALIFPLHVYSQLHDPFSLEKYRLNGVEGVNALENRAIGRIIQDDYGFLWLGTLDGLIRFDGYEVRYYKNDLAKVNSLAGDVIEDIAKDREGNLWIATQGGGLDKFEIATERFTHYQYDPADTSSIATNSIFSVLVDSRGLIWVGTFSNGLQVLDPANNKFRRIQAGQHKPIRSIIEDRSGIIWFGSDGVNRIDPTDFSVKTFSPDAGNNGPVLRGEIKTIYEDRQGKFWIAAHDDKKIFHFDPATGKYTPFSQFKSPAYVHDFCEDNAGRMWIATNNGLAIVENDQIKYFRRDLLNNGQPDKAIIITLYADKEGTMWLGTEGAGLQKVLARKEFLMFRYDDDDELSRNHRFVRSISEDDQGRIWIGWIEGGIDIFDPRSNTLTPFAEKTIDNITCIYQDYDRSFWIGTWDRGGLLHYTSDQKLIRYQNQNNDNSLPDNRVQAILRDHEGILWVSTENGLSQFDEIQNRWKPVRKPYFPYDLLGSNVQTLAFLEAPDGTLWAGTCFGLNAISPDRKKIKYYSLHNQFDASSNYSVVSLCLDKKNSDILWIGTYGSGLNRLDIPTGELQQITETNGLPSNTIYGVEQDNQGNLWLSTTNGISRYDPDTGHCSNFDVKDGLQANEFNWGAALETRDGKMFFGGSNGLNMFNPSDITHKTSTPTVAITRFEIFNKPVNVGDADSLLLKWLPDTKEITLSYEQSVFTFGFSALDYTRPEKIQYAYMLEGFDKDWNYVRNKRSATYTSLDPGRYIFRVKASNHDGVWNDGGTSVAVIITPPFWLTWWFRAISSMLIIGSLLTFYFTRIGIANRQRAALEHKVNERTKEISAKNEEILKQMEQVRHLNEEIAQQRDNIERQNSLLALSKVELEEKVTARTTELMHQNVQLEQFTFMTAHNLRAPVARLLGLTTIFNHENPIDPVNPKILRLIQKSAVDLDEVIKDIAEILHIQKGAKHPLESILVQPAIERTLNILRADINEKKVNILNKIAPGISIYGIPAYVNSVFYNIISNAVKYADPRKTSSIEMESFQKNDSVIMTFADNGFGFDHDRLKDKLFKPFSRLSTYGDGKGLGLYLVKIEVEHMNGEVNIHSKVDKGTLVTLKFPTIYQALSDVDEPNSEAGKEILQ